MLQAVTLSTGAPAFIPPQLNRLHCFPSLLFSLVGECRDPTYFGLVLSFLRDQSLRIEPLVRATNRRLGAPPPPSLASRADGKEHADGMETEDNEGLEETCVLLRELDYYGLINYVLPRQVEVELAQWSSDFADVFSVERYNLKAAQLWVDHFKKETNMAGT